MRTTIDRAGRLVIPRPLRDRVGLAGGGQARELLSGDTRARPVYEALGVRILPVG